jgi:bifunctional ADP-heptose synthase (sugar kinase/adenylyltransferase)
MKKKKIIETVVVGEMCRDIFIYGDCKRICPEAPVPVFTPDYDKEVISDGMAGNVCSNLTAMGAGSLFYCNYDIPEKTRYIDHKTNQMLLRVDSFDDKVKRITNTQLKQIKEASERINCLIISDYDKGFLHEDDIKLMTKWFEYIFMDTKKTLGSWANKVTFIKINEVEYLNTYHSLKEVRKINDKLIITRGQEGCVYGTEIFPVGEKIQTMDVSGAGDTFHAGFAVEYMRSKNIVSAIHYAQECTNLVIKKKGVATI